MVCAPQPTTNKDHPLSHQELSWTQGNLRHTQRMTQSLTLKRDEVCPYRRRRAPARGRFWGKGRFLGRGSFLGRGMNDSDGNEEKNAKTGYRLSREFTPVGSQPSSSWISSCWMLWRLLPNIRRRVCSLSNIRSSSIDADSTMHRMSDVFAEVTRSFQGDSVCRVPRSPWPCYATRGRTCVIKLASSILRHPT
jgi:hypothetical protein